MTDDKFADKASKFLVMQKHQQWFCNNGRIQAGHRNPAKIRMAEAGDPLHHRPGLSRDAYIRQATDKGYMVVKMETIIDNGFINQMEMKWRTWLLPGWTVILRKTLIDKQESSERYWVKTIPKTERCLALKCPTWMLRCGSKGLRPQKPRLLGNPARIHAADERYGSDAGGMGLLCSHARWSNTYVNGNHPVYKT